MAMLQSFDNENNKRKRILIRKSTRRIIIKNINKDNKNLKKKKNKNT